MVGRSKPNYLLSRPTELTQNESTEYFYHKFGFHKQLYEIEKPVSINHSLRFDGFLRSQFFSIAETIRSFSTWFLYFFFLLFIRFDSLHARPTDRASISRKALSTASFAALEKYTVSHFLSWRFPQLLDLSSLHCGILLSTDHAVCIACKQLVLKVEQYELQRPEFGKLRANMRSDICD